MKIGVDLGGSHIAIGLVDKGHILDKIELEMFDFKNEDRKVCVEHEIEESIETLKKRNMDKWNYIKSIGISCPGVIKNNSAFHMVNLGIEEISFSNLKKKYVDFTITLANDAKCAAFAEKKYGSMKNYSDAVFLCLGTGIGGAAFLNDVLLQPKRNSGFEFGHMVLQKDGEWCKCGNQGCFEIYGSMKRWKDKCRFVLKLDNDIDGKELLDIIKNNEKKVETQIEEYINNLVLGISNIVNILEPEVICIGGSFVHYKDIFFDRLNNSFAKAKNLFNKKDLPQIKLAVLGNDAGIIGAGMLE